MDASSSSERPARIVVGFDGSEASRRALEEAAGRAAPDGHVYVVHAFHAPGESSGGPRSDARMSDEMADARLLQEQLADIAWPAGVEWESELIAGPAADAIVRVASVRDADGIYIGTRGTGRARALLGSVAHDVLHHADRPVVIIPERAVTRSSAPLSG